MSVATAPVFRTSLPAPGARPGFAGAFRSEWTKLRSLRSTVWTIFATVMVTIGISTLFSWGNSQHLGPGDMQTFDAARYSQFGLVFGPLVFIVIGAMTITSEHATGMIRTSLTAMPRRGVVYSAKLAVFTLVALAVGLFCSFTSFFIGQQFFKHSTLRDFKGDGPGPGPGNEIITHPNLSVTLGDHGVLRAVIGGGIYLAVIGLLAFGLGAILRHTAGAITAGIGIIFILWIMTQFLPHNWKVDVDKWVPFNAGAPLWASKPITDGGINDLSTGSAFILFIGYAVVALVAGAYLFQKRDA